MMSTKYRAPFGSQTGPSSSPARKSSTSDASIAGTGALLPARLEQRDASAGRRMLGADVVIERQPEARPVRHGEAAVPRIDARRVIDQIVDPGVGEVVEVLEDF